MPPLYSILHTGYRVDDIGDGGLSLSMLSASCWNCPPVFCQILSAEKTIVIGACASFISIILHAAGFNMFWLFAGAVLEDFLVALFSGNNDAFLYDHLKSRKSEHFYKAYLGKPVPATHRAVGFNPGRQLDAASVHTFGFLLTIIPKAFVLPQHFY